MQLTTIAGGDGQPPEPDWPSIFSDEMDIAAARLAWGVATREMQEAGTLALANGSALRRLVEFSVQYERSARQVAENGPILKAKRTRVPQYNPHWVVMRQADEAMRSLEAELGIAPVRRARAQKVNRGRKTASASDRYLRSK